VPSAAPAQAAGAGVVAVVLVVEVEVVVDVVVVGAGVVVTHPAEGSATSPAGQTASPGPQVPGGRQRELKTRPVTGLV
jgi:hypothetical protein